ncbi:MAG: DUF4097 family beta strand repeat-containing protein [Thermoanaerobaculia bacterium]
MGTRSSSFVNGVAAVAALAWVTMAGAALAEKLTVPLSDATKPAELEVSLVMGSIRVTGGSGKDVLIEAKSRESAESSDGDDDGSKPRKREGMRRIPNTSIGLEAEEDRNKVSISAQSWSRAVDLEIQVPVGSSVSLSTVNEGDIDVENVDGEVEVSNTNGEIHVRNVRGPVSANTVNGDVTVVFRSGASAGRAPMAFSTLNGDVDVTFPADLKADVRMRSDNGEIYADFDIAITTEQISGTDERPKQGKFHAIVGREMTGKINGGGPEMLFKTFNGDILLRRAKN